MSNDATRAESPRRDALVAWLACVVRVANATAFIGHGLDVLIDAALTSGGGRRSRTDPGRATIWPEAFERLLCSLPRRCSTPLDRSDLALEGFRSSLHTHLVATRRGFKHVRLDEAGLVALVGRIRARLAALKKRAPSTNFDTEIDATPPSLEGLARAAYAVLKARSEELDVGPIDTDAVVLLGAVRAALVTRTVQCKFCFRWARPGSRYCFEHTLSGPGQFARERQRRYAAAAEIAHRFKTMPEARRVAPSLNVGQTRTLMARLLLGSVAPKEDARLLRISQALRRSPKLLAALGQDLAQIPPRLLHAELRLRLDPLEWRLGGWLAKIRAAEAWYSLSPGTRGRGRATTERMQDAVRLARRGLSKSEVARKLGLSASAVSRWFQRHPDDPVIRELAELFRQSRGTLTR